MSPLFKKLNLKDQAEIVVLGAPESVEGELDALDGVNVRRRLTGVRSIAFALMFVTKQKDVDRLARSVLAKVDGDATVWFAYPKGSSKKYTCDFNRDNGWDVVGGLGYEGVRMVSIDEDWSALRFRHVDYIKKLTRDRSWRISEAGKRRED